MPNISYEWAGVKCFGFFLLTCQETGRGDEGAAWSEHDMWNEVQSHAGHVPGNTFEMFSTPAVNTLAALYVTST